MGACLTQIRRAAEVLEIEANAVSDNPLVFAEQGDVLSGGNFHAEPVAMAADNRPGVCRNRFAVRTPHLADDGQAHVAAATVPGGERRRELRLHDRPVTAAALASENKALAHPSSVDSIPTSANREDHVSMAPAAGRRLWSMADNVRGILAVEWLAACRAWISATA